jgi:mycofactocin system FadH/OYE family oxidoreductase 2
VLIEEPLQVGPVRLRNRLVFSAHLTNAAVDGLPTEQHIAYYAARAAGGAGLVITEEHSVHPDDRPYEKLIRGHDPAVVPIYRRLTDAVHEYGAVVLAQLNHNGGQSSGMYSRRPVLAPSPVADPMFREVPKEITAAEIRELVDGYALVARHCAEGGFDGVELQCAHASVLRQFLSPLTNHRTDGYGGSLERRARMLLEVLAAVRAVLGPDRVVGVRLCGDEGLPGGIPLAEMVATARLVEPYVDYVNTAVGVATATLYLIEASMHTEPGYALGVSAAVKDAVSVPVVGVGRFTEPAHAERALAEGRCDLVGVVRGQIADPGFAAGAGGTGRTCTGCNQECVGRVGLNRTLGCAVNPRAGREAVPLPAPRPARRVLVAGAGPAGLQAAVTAAERGHRVLLCERDTGPGGQLLLAATAPGRGELGHVVRDLLADCHRLGVTVRTGTPVDLALVCAEEPDAVVLATGAHPARPVWAGDCARVVDVSDVLAGRAAPTGSVLVHDELGRHAATSVAELLAARGARVEIMTPALVVGQDLAGTLDLELFHRRAHRAGIALSTDRVVLAATGAVVLTVLEHTTGAVAEARYDWVVTAGAPEPADELWRALRDVPGVVLHRAGDCLAPRHAPDAVRDGYRIGLAL